MSGNHSGPHAMTDRLQLPPAMGLCPLCIGGPARHDQELNHIAIYCAHRLAGAVLDLDGVPMRWNIITPIEVEEWVRLLNETKAAYLATRAPLTSP